jgi:hypothetical protein
MLQGKGPTMTYEVKTGTNTRSGLNAALPAHVPRRSVEPGIASVADSDGVVTDPGLKDAGTPSW